MPTPVWDLADNDPPTPLPAQYQRTLSHILVRISTAGDASQGAGWLEVLEGLLAAADNHKQLSPEVEHPTSPTQRATRKTTTSSKENES